MTTVGVVGGIGPESTIDYYRSTVTSYRAARGDGSYPSIVINSIDNTKMLTLVEGNALQEVAAYLSEAVNALARAGADFAALAANTPHIVFNDLQRISPIPLISIVTTTLRAAQAAGAKRVGLLGTRFTMKGSFYPSEFACAGIHVVIPEPDDLAWVHEKYLTELVNGQFHETTRVAFLTIIEKMVSQQQIDALILGGTELPLLLRGTTGVTIPLLDTAALHVEAIVAHLLA